VNEYKERDGRICSKVCCLSTNKGRTLEANKMIATFFDSRKLKNITIDFVSGPPKGKR